MLRPGIAGMRGSMVIRLRPCMIMSIAPPRAGEGGPLEAAPEAIKIRVLLCFASQSGLNTTCTVGGCGQHRKEHGKNQEKVHGRCGDDVASFTTFSFAQALIKHGTLLYSMSLRRGRRLPSSLISSLFPKLFSWVSILYYDVFLGRT